MKHILLSVIALTFAALPAQAGKQPCNQTAHNHVAPVEHVAAPVAPVKPEEPKVATAKPAEPTKPTVAPVTSRTTLAGDLGIKYNLGRDVNMTAKYGTDNRYGLALGYQATPSFGLEAEAYRKDGDTAVRAGLIYTINPSAPLKETKVVERVVDRTVEKVVYKTIIKVVPYKPSKAPRGRG